MNYYLDCEFLEGTQKEKFPISLFRKNTPPTIDLISIGIVSEESVEYYAISKDFNLREAWNRYDLKTINGDINPIKYRRYGRKLPLPYVKKVYWIRENVLKPIWKELMKKRLGLFNQISLEEELFDSRFTYKNLKNLIKENGKTNKQIAEEVKNFCGDIDSRVRSFKKGNGFDPKFYAYYADYDWVAFCWLFGKMMDLPTGYPKYCIDLKQILDEKIDKINFDAQLRSPGCPLVTCKSMKENNPMFPIQENAHNALADAKFNKKLHEFLKNMQNETNKI
jgi:hypothetical protein